MIRLLIVWSALIIASSSAYAAGAPTGVKLMQPSAPQPLKDRQIYEINFDCGLGTKPLPTNWQQFDQSMFEAAVHIGQSVNHQILISTDAPTVDATTSKLTLPAKAVSMFTLFSVAAQSGVVGDFRRLCTGSVYVPGGQTFNLITTVSWSKQYTEGPLVATLYAFGKLISPIW